MIRSEGMFDDVMWRSMKQCMIRREMCVRECAYVCIVYVCDCLHECM